MEIIGKIFFAWIIKLRYYKIKELRKKSFDKNFRSKFFSKRNHWLLN